MATAPTPPSEDLFDMIDKLIATLEQRQQPPMPAGTPSFHELAATLREQRQAFQGALEEFDATINADVAKTLAEIEETTKQAQTPPPAAPETLPEPVVPIAGPQFDARLGERLREEFLRFLSNAPAPSPHTAGRASLNFADWAMGTSGIIEPTSGSAESWVLGGLLTETGDRRAIWIGRLSIAELTQRAKVTLNVAELAALEAATQWVLTPTAAQKSVAAAAFANIKDDALIRGLGRAIAAAQPESAITNETVAAGVLEAIHRCSVALTVDDERANYRRQVLHIARTVFNGTALWNSAQVAEKPTAQNFDSWFMTSRGSN